jgi:hypothetical protein
MPGLDEGESRISPNVYRGKGFVNWRGKAERRNGGTGERENGGTGE